jgi:hypothetical protein
VTISFSKNVFAEVYDAASPSDFGRILLRQENVVIGVGVIRDILDS